MPSEKRPDVSVVIAAFNAQETLARAIDSALRQQGVAVEVVAVDDCSTDRTLEIVGSLDAAPLRVVALEQNRGPGGARNAGLEAATGRFVAVLDADDTMHPDRLARMIARAEKKSAQIVVDNLAMVPEAGGEGTPMFPRAVLENMKELSLAGFIAANLMFEDSTSFGYMKPVFERDFIERHGLRYDTGLRIGEDYIFLASALAEGARCVVVPEALYAYHISAGSISRVLELHHVEAMLSHYGEQTGVRMARKHIGWYSKGLPGSAEFRSAVNRTGDAAGVRALLADFYEPLIARGVTRAVVAELEPVKEAA